MNRAGTLILALALTVTGCVELPKTAEMKAPPKEAKPAAVVDAPPVLPEQVEDGNARQALDALRDELNRAAVQPAPTRNSDR